MTKMIKSKKEFVAAEPGWTLQLEEKPSGPDKIHFVRTELKDGAIPPVIASRQMIKERIRDLREWSSEIIGQEGSPAQYKDIINEAIKTGVGNRAYWAARVLERIDDIERELANIERCPVIGVSLMRQSVYNGFFYALMLPSETHYLTLVDCESGILQNAKLAKNREAGSAALHNERVPEHQRWQDAAAVIWKKEPQLKKQPVARRVKRKLGLKERVPTIAKRLKNPVTAC
jgi:hypothetical protein